MDRNDTNRTSSLDLGICSVEFAFSSNCMLGVLGMSNVLDKMTEELSVLHVHRMAKESLPPYEFIELENALNILCKTRTNISIEELK